MTFEFGPPGGSNKYEVIEEDGLYLNGSRLSLGRSACIVIELLARSAGRVQPHQSILDAVSAQRPVAADTMADQFSAEIIRQIRDAMPDKGAIQTVRGVGYQLVWQVQRKPDAPHPVTRHSGGPLRSKRTLSIFAFFLILLSAILVNWMRHPRKQDPVIAILPFDCSAATDSHDVAGDCDTLRADIRADLMALPRVRVAPARVTEDSMWLRHKWRLEDLSRLASRFPSAEVEVLDATLTSNSSTQVLSLELIDATGPLSAKWSTTHPFTSSEFLAISSDVVRGIYQRVVGDLNPAEELILAERQPKDYGALKQYSAGIAYQAGLDRTNRRSSDDLWKSISYFQEAIHKDPTYALPYAAEAGTYVLLYEYGGLRRADARREAKKAADKALQYGTTLAETHAALGNIYDTFDWDWKSAEKEYQEAIHLNPHYSTAHSWYSTLLAIQARFSEALLESQKAEEEDPESLAAQTSEAWILMFMRQYDRAINKLESVRLADPTFGPALWRLAELYQLTGQSEKAVQILSLPKLTPSEKATLGYLNAVRKEGDKAATIIQDYANDSNPSSYRIATIYSGLKNFDRAFDYLEKARCNRDNLLPYINVDPLMDSLRSDPRFADLRDRLFSRTGGPFLGCNSVEDI